MLQFDIPAGGHTTKSVGQISMTPLSSPRADVSL